MFRDLLHFVMLLLTVLHFAEVHQVVLHFVNKYFSSCREPHIKKNTGSNGDVWLFFHHVVGHTFTSFFMRCLHIMSFGPLVCPFGSFVEDPA